MVAPITEWDEYAGTIPGTGYTFEMEALPPGFPYQQSPCGNDDRPISVPNSAGSAWFRVFAADGAVQIAYAIFAADGAVVRCDDVNVDALHRRKGIADFLYRFVACLFQGPVIPSDRLLEDGERFWNGRAQIVWQPSTPRE